MPSRPEDERLLEGPVVVGAVEQLVGADGGQLVEVGQRKGSRSLPRSAPTRRPSRPRTRRSRPCDVPGRAPGGEAAPSLRRGPAGGSRPPPTRRTPRGRPPRAHGARAVRGGRFAPPAIAPGSRTRPAPRRAPRPCSGATSARRGMPRSRSLSPRSRVARAQLARRGERPRGVVAHGGEGERVRRGAGAPRRSGAPRARVRRAAPRRRGARRGRSPSYLGRPLEAEELLDLVEDAVSSLRHARPSRLVVEPLGPPRARRRAWPACSRTARRPRAARRGSVRSPPCRGGSTRRPSGRRRRPSRLAGHAAPSRRRSRAPRCAATALASVPLLDVAPDLDLARARGCRASGRRRPAGSRSRRP